MPDQRTFRIVGESLLREERLRRRADFRCCYERGRRLHGRWVTLYVLERGRETALPRLGITVTRKVGGAVVRQKMKRRIREIYRRWNRRRQLPPYDIVVHVKPRAATVDFATLQTEILHLLQPLVQRELQVG
jgi:ribonuclease P protein component